MDVLTEGIPDDAFTAVTGDDKKVASAFKKKNRDERKGQASLSMFHMANDSNLFRTKDELQQAGCFLQGNQFTNGEGNFLPLWTLTQIL